MTSHCDKVVQINGLSRRYGRQQALDDVTLDVPTGGVFGLVGENGAGKTTLLKHILGLLKAEQGTVRVFGLDPVKQPEEVLKNIGYLSEDRDMPEWMKVADLIHYHSAFFPDWDHAYAAELQQMFDLPTKQRVRTLSRGQLARVGLLLAIAHRPQLLVLDEPSSGLDPVVRRDILAAIIRTVADEGRTVLFSSHLLDEVQRVSDSVAMLNHGKVLLCGGLADVQQQHVRFVIRLETPLVAAPEIPGALTCTGEQNEWSVLCNGQADDVRRWIQQANAEILEQTSATLEEIFVARVAQARCG
ncbi:MAG: ABC transporter ATP-binding protein [Planctomycetaceae bacterium]